LQQKETYVVSRHQFLRALLFRDGEHYDPSTSELANVFDISEHDGKEHFLTLMIIAQLDLWGRSRPGEGFVEAGDLFTTFETTGFGPEQIDFALQRGIASGLIEGVEKDSTRSGSPHEFVRIATTGGYYLRTLARMFSYVDAMVIDTPIVEESYRERIQNVEEIDERLGRAVIFVEYLDRQWAPIAERQHALDWPEISSEIVADIRTIRDHPRRERKHHH